MLRYALAILLTFTTTAAMAGDCTCDDCACSVGQRPDRIQFVRLRMARRQERRKLRRAERVERRMQRHCDC